MRGNVEGFSLLQVELRGLKEKGRSSPLNWREFLVG